MITDLKFFLLGLWECTSDCTISVGNYYIEIYDKGRAIGRKILGFTD